MVGLRLDESSSVGWRLGCSFLVAEEFGEILSSAVTIITTAARFLPHYSGHCLPQLFHVAFIVGYLRGFYLHTMRAFASVDVPTQVDQQQRQNVCSASPVFLFSSCLLGSQRHTTASVGQISVESVQLGSVCPVVLTALCRIVLRFRQPTGPAAHSRQCRAETLRDRPRTRSSRTSSTAGMSSTGALNVASACRVRM